MPKYDRSKADRNYLGYFADVSALQAFKAVGVDGDFAVVDDAIYIWDSDTSDWIAVSGGGGGSGDVTGPASSTDNALARFDLTTGKLLQNGIVLESDNGDLSAVNSLSLATSPVSAPTSEGSMYWNTTDKCLNINTGISGVVLNTGQESVIRVRNSTGSTIPNGSVVYINGATGNRPTVTLAQANTAATSTLIGMVTEDISNNDDGFVTTFGLVRELDTSTYTENDSIYLSASTPGGFTNVAPSSPNFVVFIGRVTRVNVSNGEILVTPQPFVSGVTSVDSLRVHDSLMVIGSNGLSLGRASSVVGKEVYYNGTNANTVTIQSGTTSASYTLTLPTSVASAGQVLTDAAGNGVLSWTTPSGLSWGATATGTSGTGVTLTVGNSASSGTVAQSIVIGNTQTNSILGLSIDTGTSSSANHTGVHVTCLRSGGGTTGGIVVNRFASATQAIGGTNTSILLNRNFNTNSTVSATALWVWNEENASSGVNTGMRIDQFHTTIAGTGNTAHFDGAAISIPVQGTGGTAVGIWGADNVNSSTNGLVQYRLSNTQSGASIVQKIDLGTSAQGHTGISILVPNASVSARGMTIEGSSSGIGEGIYISASSASFRGITVEGYGAAGLSGKALRILTDSTTAQSAGMIYMQINTGVTNPSIGMRFDAQTSAQAHTLCSMNIAGANTSQVAYLATLAATGTGVAFRSTSSAPSGAGRFVDFSHTANTTLTANTTNPFSLSSSRTHTAATTVTDNYNLGYIVRTNVSNNASAVFNAQGSVLKLENVATQTSGTLSDSVSVLYVVQDNDSTGGHILFNSYSGSPTTDGVFWFDGTNFKYRAGGATKTITAV